MRPPAIAPTVLKRISLSAGSLPGTSIWVSSTVVVSIKPKTAAKTTERFQLTTMPKGTKRHTFTIASARPRPPNLTANEKGWVLLPVGVRVATRIANKTSEIAIVRAVGARQRTILGILGNGYLEGAIYDRVAYIRYQRSREKYLDRAPGNKGAHPYR
jgi:hypothetical protein